MKKQGDLGLVAGIFLIILILLISGFYLATNQKPNPGGETPSLPLSKEQITLYTEELPPFNYIDRNGRINGRSTELVKEIASRAGSKISINLVEWSDGYNTVLTEPETGLFSTARTHDRDSIFKWVGPIGSVEAAFFGRDEDNTLFNNLMDVKNVSTIAVVQNDARYQLLTREGFSNLLVLPDERSCIAALTDHTADLWLGSKDSYSQNAIQIGDDMDQIRLVMSYKTNDLNIALNRKTPESVVQKWQNALDSMKADGTYDMIQNRYMPYICSWVRCTS
jgi:ABC-type amino acid transport substrate-binding protein